MFLVGTGFVPQFCRRGAHRGPHLRQVGRVDPRHVTEVLLGRRALRSRSGENLVTFAVPIRRPMCVGGSTDVGRCERSEECGLKFWKRWTNEQAGGRIACYFLDLSV